MNYWPILWPFICGCWPFIILFSPFTLLLAVGLHRRDRPKIARWGSRTQPTGQDLQEFPDNHGWTHVVPICKARLRDSSDLVDHHADGAKTWPFCRRMVRDCYEKAQPFVGPQYSSQHCSRF